MNKRIAFILGSMNRGGAERVVSILANHYATKGWNVDIILLLSGECKYHLDEKIKVISLANINQSRISQLPKWLSSIRNYIKINKPDSILAFAARINIITAIASLGISNRLVVSERNDPLSDGRSIFLKALTKFIYPLTDKVVFQTIRSQSYFNERVKRNSVIIHNPVKVEVKASRNKNKQIVAVGRLENQKNHALLIDAFQEVHKIHPEYKLFIYGEGSLRRTLATKIKKLGLNEVISMPGNIENIHQEMAKSDIFVLPSNYEGLSNALLEALMMGLPCISTNCAGSDEIIKDGENGYLVGVGNKNELSAKIVRLIENHELRIEIGDKAIESSRQFESETILKKWEEVLENND